MELVSTELYYEYRAKEYAERFQKYSDAAIKDLKRQVGNEPGVGIMLYRNPQNYKITQ